MSILVPVVTAVLIIVLARSAFRLARRRAARRLAPELSAELRQHKLECLHEPPERVQLEMELLLGEESVAASPKGTTWRR